MPKLIILIGPPGSGKTHFAERFALKNNYIHVNSDQVRMNFIKNPTFTPQERASVYEEMFRVVEQNLQNDKNVLFDGNLVTNADRKRVLNMYQECAEVLFVYFDVPQKRAFERATQRVVTEDKLYKPMNMDRARMMHKKFEQIDPELPHAIVNGLAEFEEQENSVLSVAK